MREFIHSGYLDPDADVQVQPPLVTAEAQWNQEKIRRSQRLVPPPDDRHRRLKLDAAFSAFCSQLVREPALQGAGPDAHHGDGVPHRRAGVVQEKEQDAVLSSESVEGLPTVEGELQRPIVRQGGPAVRVPAPEVARQLSDGPCKCAAGDRAMARRVAACRLVRVALGVAHNLPAAVAGVGAGDLDGLDDLLEGQTAGRAEGEEAGVASVHLGAARGACDVPILALNHQTTRRKR